MLHLLFKGKVIISRVFKTIVIVSLKVDKKNTQKLANLKIKVNLKFAS